jgi:hypothetical protein
MEASDLIQTGDTFIGDYEELTVLSVGDETAKVETLAGTTKEVELRDLVEIATEQREPVTL